MIFGETIEFGNNILWQSNISQKILRQIFESLSSLLSAWDMELLISFKSNLLTMGITSFVFRHGKKVEK